MRLYLVRHGEALSSEADPARSLSDRGRYDVSRVAARLREMKVALADIRHSPKARAAQTAGIIAAELGAAAREVAGLKPNDPVDPVVQEVERSGQDLMLVGHLPFLPVLAARLLGEAAARSSIDFPTAGVVILHRDEDGLWRVQDQIGPENP